jgi:hypothetical protein
MGSLPKRGFDLALAEFEFVEDSDRWNVNLPHLMGQEFSVVG